jgi:hypothetical protein
VADAPGGVGDARRAGTHRTQRAASTEFPPRRTSRKDTSDYFSSDCTFTSFRTRPMAVAAGPAAAADRGDRLNPIEPPAIMN